MSLGLLVQVIRPFISGFFLCPFFGHTPGIFSCFVFIHRGYYARYYVVYVSKFNSILSIYYVSRLIIFGFYLYSQNGD